MSEKQIKPLQELTIEDIINDIFKTYAIKKKRRDIITYYQQIYQVDLFGKGCDDIDEKAIAQKIDSILKDDKTQFNPYLSYSNAYYRKAKRKGTIITRLPFLDSNYMGKGGECVVMGELLFRGYNVNSMMVDEGIDLVASKDNVFYYIQVKTKNVEENERFYFQIKQERFSSFLGTQMRYILVGRCRQNGEIRNEYFVFSNNDIQRFLFSKIIPQPSAGSNNLSIKIEHDARTNQFFLYDGKFREDITFFHNNFSL